MTHDTNTIQFGSDAKTLEETVDTLAAVAGDNSATLWFDTPKGHTHQYDADTLHEMKGFVGADGNNGLIYTEIVLTVHK